MTIPIIVNHIHLSTALGSAPEYSPDLSWKVIEQAEIPVAFLSVRRGLKGHLRVGRVLEGGTPVQLTNWMYQVKVVGDNTYTAWEKKEQLKLLHGQSCYFVPNYHCADGSDHTEFVRQVFVSNIGKFSSDHIGLQFYYVQIELEDASR